jgi:hypothetical protein
MKSAVSNNRHILNNNFTLTLAGNWTTLHYKNIPLKFRVKNIDLWNIFFSSERISRTVWSYDGDKYDIYSDIRDVIQHGRCESFFQMKGLSQLYCPEHGDSRVIRKICNYYKCTAIPWMQRAPIELLQTNYFNACVLSRCNSLFSLSHSVQENVCCPIVLQRPYGVEENFFRLTDLF